MLRKILFILVFIWWVGTVFYLWNGTRAIEPVLLPELDIVVLGELEKQEWRSIYFHGEKIGYSSKSVQRIQDKFMATDITYFRLPVGGIIQEIYAQGITTVDSTFAVRSFSFDLQSGDYNTTAEGGIRDGILSVVIATSESRDTLQFPLDGEVYPPSFLPEMFISAKKSGRELIEIPTFDPFTVSRVSYEIKSAHRKRRIIGGKKREVWVLHILAQGLYSEMWISDEGELLHENSSTGFTQLLESQADALKFDLSSSGNFDILTGYAIRADWSETISPRNAAYAVYVLDGFPDGLFELEDFNQKISVDTLFICMNGFAEDTMPRTNRISLSDTVDTPFIQSNDKRVLRVAQKIITGIDDSLEMLKEINNYLFENIEKEYQTSIPSALDVLQKMKGDCNEHSTLFVALARSLGIPARIDVGFVYREDGYFLYHAWVQAWVYGKWHTFEPTFGQYPADAAHIKLLSGSIEKQVQLLRLGTVSIKVVNAEEQCQE